MTLRRGVAAVILNSQSLVLAGERRGDDGWQWQIPQGGLETGESPEDGLHREVEEETGLRDLKIIKKTAGFIPYVFPPEIKKKSYQGQEHIYFIMDGSRIQESDWRASQEFKSFKWMKIEDLIAEVVVWKREAYRQAFQELELVQP